MGSAAPSGITTRERRWMRWIRARSAVDLECSVREPFLHCNEKLLVGEPGYFFKIVCEINIRNSTNIPHSQAHQISFHRLKARLCFLNQRYRIRVNFTSQFSFQLARLFTVYSHLRSVEGSWAEVANALLTSLSTARNCVYSRLICMLVLNSFELLFFPKEGRKKKVELEKSFAPLESIIQLHEKGNWTH